MQIGALGGGSNFASARPVENSGPAAQGPGKVGAETSETTTQQSGAAPSAKAEGLATAGSAGPSQSPDPLKGNLLNIAV